MWCLENSDYQPPSLRRLSCYKDELISKCLFFHFHFPVPTNISKQINGYETAIVKRIPSSKREFFLSVFVASHPKHPQGKHS